jgi:septal ring factor EnvC (AmiA/AmiB activator)
MKMTFLDRFLTTALLVSVLLPLLCGCETIGQRRQRERMQQREDYLVMQESTHRLTGRAESLEMEIAGLEREIQQLRAETRNTVQAEMGTMDSRLSDLERSVRNLEKSRQADKQEIIDTISKKVAQLMQSSGSGTVRRGRSSEYGYEHVVESGQTLSEIAAVYGVSVSVIVEENGIKNPNSLRVGQTLFIPE